MWKCKFCSNEFEFSSADKSKKANHTRWCLENPKSKEFRDKIFLNRGWSKGLNKFTDPRIGNISEGVKRHLLDHDAAFKNKSHSLTTCEKIAKKMIGNKNGNHRGDRQSLYKNIRMDSSWEVKVAKYLDEQDISWKYGEVVFKLDGKRSYRPDFVLEDGTIIEVKGYWRPANKEKFEEWQMKYPDVKFEFWDKKKLKELKLI